MPPLADTIAEARRILDTARAKGIIIRLFGGLSFYFRCPSAKHRALQRNYVDIDVMAYARQAKEIRQLFNELGYTPRERFNAMQGYKRLIFNDLENGRRVDIFLDVFEMCHKINLKDRLKIDEDTIPLADMLATKLQIIELNEKDAKDIIALLRDYEIGDNDNNMINGSYLAKLCSQDWGLYKTFMMNLTRIRGILSSIDIADKQEIEDRMKVLQEMIEKEPKSLKWRMREKIGEKVRWYELPEPDTAVVDSAIKTNNTIK